MKTIELIISGEVQGVFYRAFATREAKRLGLKGWVRNASNGTVEILATGFDEELNKFKDWCKQGPPKAVVIHVEEKPHQLMQFTQFEVIK